MNNKYEKPVARNINDRLPNAIGHCNTGERAGSDGCITGPSVTNPCTDGSNAQGSCNAHGLYAIGGCNPTGTAAGGTCSEGSTPQQEY